MVQTITPPVAARFATWAAERRWTEADYLLFANDENAILDLVDGKVVLHDMPTPRHQAVVVALAAALGRSREGRVLVAPMPVRLRADRMREPDVVFYRTEHLDRLHEQYADPPDLVIEVLSPATRRVDEVDKRTEYGAAGIPEYWIVDAEAGTIAVFRLRGQGYADPLGYGRGDVVQPAAAPDAPVRVDDIVAG